MIKGVSKLFAHDFCSSSIQYVVVSIVLFSTKKILEQKRYLHTHKYIKKSTFYIKVNKNN